MIPEYLEGLPEALTLLLHASDYQRRRPRVGRVADDAGIPVAKRILAGGCAELPCQTVAACRCPLLWNYTFAAAADLLRHSSAVPKRGSISACVSPGACCYSIALGSRSDL